MIDKKEIKRKYKETIQPMGIYQIRNLVNNKVFIGSNKNLTAKFNSYKFQLKQRTFMNSLLQADYNNFGEESFAFEIIDYLKPVDDLSYDYTKDLETLLELWLDKIQPFDEKGYHTKKPG